MAKHKFDVKFESRVPELLAVVGQSGRQKAYAMGTAYRKTLVDEVLTGDRNGLWYKVPGTNRMYRASRSGEPPASRTGDLRRSYRVGPVKGTGVDSSVTVGSALDYARRLEEEMNRKHMEPAFQLARPELERILRSDWAVK